MKANLSIYFAQRVTFGMNYLLNVSKIIIFVLKVTDGLELPCNIELMKNQANMGGGGLKLQLTSQRPTSIK